MKPKIDLRMLVIGMAVSMAVAALCTALGLPTFMMQTGVALSWFDRAVNGSAAATGVFFVLTLWLNLFFISSMVVKRITPKAFALWACMLPVVAVISYFEVAPIVYILILLGAVLNRGGMSMKRVIARFFIIECIDFIYSLSTYFIKSGLVQVAHLDILYSEYLHFAVDYWVFLGLMLWHCLRGGDFVDEILDTVYVHFFRRERVLAHGEGDQESVREVIRIRDHEYESGYELGVIGKVLATVLPIMPLLVIAFLASLDNRLVVFLLLYLAGFMPQRVSPKAMYIFHGRTYIECSVMSVTFISALCYTVPELRTSFISPCVAGASGFLLTSWYMFKTMPPLTPDNMSNSELLRLLEYMNPSEDDRKVILAVFTRDKDGNRPRADDVANAIGYDTGSLRNKKTAYVKRMRAAIDKLMSM